MDRHQYKARIIAACLALVCVGGYALSTRTKPVENSSAVATLPTHGHSDQTETVQAVSSPLTVSLAVPRIVPTQHIPPAYIAAKRSRRSKAVRADTLVHYDKRSPSATPSATPAKPSARHEVPVTPTATPPVTLLEASPSESTAEVPRDRTAQSEISFAMLAGYSRIDSTYNSSTAKLPSKPIIGADLKWQQNWSPSFQTFIRWNYSAVTFEEANRGTVNGGSGSTSLMAIGATHVFNPSFQTSLEVGAREQIFTPSYSAGSVTVEMKNVPFAAVHISKDFFKIQDLCLSGGLSAAYLFGSDDGSYAIKSGYSYSGKLQITHQMPSFSIFANGEYEQQNQNTSITTQSRTDVRSRLGFVVPFGGGKNP